MSDLGARKARLQQRANAGDARARIALELANAPNRFLPTVRIGITLIGILAGAFGRATLASELAARLRLISLGWRSIVRSSAWRSWYHRSSAGRSSLDTAECELARVQQPV
jgi:CBS domain containing-hemolysin-like protein